MGSGHQTYAMRLDVTETGTTSRLSEQVAEEIRAILGRRRMSQAALARALGVSPMWVNYRLTGTQPIDLNDLDRIAAVLDVDVTELLPQREGRLIAVGGTTLTQGGDIKRQKPLMPKGMSPLSPNGSRPHIAAPANRRTGRVMPVLQAA
jgi:DNA-binding Xre family transcriptional regulator